MERSQVKQDSLSLIEFKLQKRRLEVQLAVTGNVTFILNHISIPTYMTYMLQGSKGQVTVNGSNQIQTSCGNLDHPHLGFDNTTKQSTTNHEPRTRKHNPWLDIPKVDLGLQSSTIFNHLHSSTGLA